MQCCMCRRHVHEVLSSYNVDVVAEVLFTQLLILSNQDDYLLDRLFLTKPADLLTSVSCLLRHLCQSSTFCSINCFLGFLLISVCHCETIHWKTYT